MCVWGNQNVFCIKGLLKSQLNILPTYDTYGVVHTDTHEDVPTDIHVREHECPQEGGIAETELPRVKSNHRNHLFPQILTNPDPSS